MPISKIPYYVKDAGIKTYPAAQGGGFYVVLDKFAVENLDQDRWDTFEDVKTECERELRTFLEIKEAVLANSPVGDSTYILNFSSGESLL